MGRETACVFAERGARVVVFADLNLAAAQEAAVESQKLATHPQYQPLPVEIDTTNKQLVHSVIDQVVQKFARIDYFINFAGVRRITLR